MNLPVHPDQCGHSRTALRYRLDKNGNKRYQQQCQDCWQPVGSCIRKGVATKEIPLEQIPPFDELAQARQWSDWQEVTRVQGDAELRYLKPQYDEYIRSDSWRRKRERVMARANDRCEGCGLNRATQVHHLTYENLGNEFL